MSFHIYFYHSVSLSGEQHMAHPVKVSVRVFWHVIVEGNIDSLDVHPSSKQVGGHQDPPLEVLELLVARQTTEDNK